MKKAFIISLLFISTLNILAQSPTAIKITAAIGNRIRDTIVIRGANASQHVILINARQQFEATFEAPKGFYHLSNGREASSIYLKPSAKLTLTTDAAKFSESIIYSGKGSDESNFLAQYTRREENVTQEATTKEECDFQKLFEIKKKEDRANLESGDFDPEFTTILLASFENNYR